MKPTIITRAALVSLLLAPCLAAPQDAAVTADAPKQPAAVPFLWQVEGQGASAYLFGTLHLPDDRVVRLSKTVEAAFEASDAFYAEIETTPEAELEVLSMVQLDPGQSLVKLLGPETWASVEARFVKAGRRAADARAMAGFKPWVFGSLIATLDYLDEQQRGKLPLDKALFQRAQKEGKTVGGLETVAEQVNSFEVFSLEEQVQMLRETLEQLDEYDAEGRDAIQEMIAAWLSGDDATLMALLDDGFGKDPELRARAEASILWDRNRRLATRIRGLMTKRPTEVAFFAVGALHLPDAPTPPRPEGATPEALAEHARLTAEAERKLGIVSLLRKRGYRVTRIRPAASAPVPAGADK